MSLRIAVVTDIHHGTPTLTKRSDAALELLAGFAEFVNDSQPDLVLDLGDRICDVDHDTDFRLQREVAEVFRSISPPVHHICGNHDLHHLDATENARILGQPLASEALDIDGWRIALWRADSSFRIDGERRGFRLPESDLRWLSDMAQATDRPTLVVGHVPFSGHSQTGNYYFENNPQSATYPEAAHARSALAAASQPVICLAGHVHWNTVTQVNGIAHLTQQSLTESYTTCGAPAGAYGLIELSDTVHWRVFGRDPFEARLSPRAHRWTPPIGPLPDRD